jgi:hypothetical protein
VKEILDHADIYYSINADAIRLDKAPVADVINLGDADPKKVQGLLDDAVVKVSISFVNGEYREYYDSYKLIERYDVLLQEGLLGKQLVHELLTDDWGPPPVGVRLEGRRKDNRDFHAHIEYR